VLFQSCRRRPFSAIPPNRWGRSDKQIVQLGAVHGVEHGRDIADRAADRELSLHHSRVSLAALFLKRGGDAVHVLGVIRQWADIPL
jgi:hypothetical protein